MDQPSQCNSESRSMLNFSINTTKLANTTYFPVRRWEKFAWPDMAIIRRIKKLYLQPLFFLNLDHSVFQKLLLSLLPILAPYNFLVYELFEKAS